MHKRPTIHPQIIVGKSALRVYPLVEACSPSWKARDSASVDRPRRAPMTHCADAQMGRERSSEGCGSSMRAAGSPVARRCATRGGCWPG